MTPIIKYATQCHESGELPVISLDTETTGLNTVNLAADNPSRSHCVSIQLSWEEDQELQFLMIWNILQMLIYIM